MTVCVESESRSVGGVFLPDSFWESMNRSTVIEIQVSKTHRVERLVTDYGSFEPGLLSDAILRIQKRLGNEVTRSCLDALEQGRVDLVAARLLDYYDKSYTFSREKHKKAAASKVDCPDGDPRHNADLLIRQANQLSL